MAIEPKRYREKDPNNARREYQRAYREAHREELAEAKRRWQAENLDRAYASAKRSRLRKRAEMIEAYGGRCACCGETRPEFLTLDHIGGGGADERRADGVKHNAQLITRLRNMGWPQGRYQLLCWNCQFAVFWGDCPHQRVA